jgi:hypothetical protein
MAALLTTCLGNNMFLCEAQGLPRGGKASPQNTTPAVAMPITKRQYGRLAALKSQVARKALGRFQAQPKIGPVGPIGQSCLSLMRNC